MYRRTYDKEHNQGQIVVSREIYAKSVVMIRGDFFWGGDKVEGSIQNVKNYGIIKKYKVLRAGAQIHIIGF